MKLQKYSFKQTITKYFVLKRVYPKSRLGNSLKNVNLHNKVFNGTAILIPSRTASQYLNELCCMVRRNIESLFEIRRIKKGMRMTGLTDCDQLAVKCLYRTIFRKSRSIRDMAELNRFFLRFVRKRKRFSSSFWLKVQLAMTVTTTSMQLLS